MKRFVVSLLLLMGAMPSFAASTLDAHEPAAILQAALQIGEARLLKDAEGDPLIHAKVDGVAYGIYFFGCTGKGVGCDSLQLVAGWSKAKVPLERLNSWNAEQRFSTAFLDGESDPGLLLDINLRHGVSKRNFADTLMRWRSALRHFRQDVLGQAA